MNTLELIHKCLYARDRLRLLSTEIQTLIYDLEENTLEYSEENYDTALRLFDSIGDNLMEINSLINHTKECGTLTNIRRPRRRIVKRQRI